MFQQEIGNEMEIKQGLGTSETNRNVWWGGGAEKEHDFSLMQFLEQQTGFWNISVFWQMQMTKWKSNYGVYNPSLIVIIMNLEEMS
jgi:hypothetical protein